LYLIARSGIEVAVEVAVAVAVEVASVPSVVK